MKSYTDGFQNTNGPLVEASLKQDVFEVVLLSVDRIGWDTFEVPQWFDEVGILVEIVVRSGLCRSLTCLLFSISIPEGRDDKLITILKRPRLFDV